MCAKRGVTVELCVLAVPVLGEVDAGTAEGFLAFWVYLQPFPINFGEEKTKSILWAIS